MSDAKGPPNTTIVKVFAALCLVGGLALVVFGVFFLRDGFASSSWPTAQGQVIRAGSQRTSSSSGTGSSRTRKYHPTIDYRYEVAGRSFESDRYSLGDGPNLGGSFGDAASAAAEARRRYPRGEPVTVYYDPVDPASAVLSPGPNIGTWMPLVLGLVLFLPVGVLLLMGLRKQAASARVAADGASG